MSEPVVEELATGSGAPVRRSSLVAVGALFLINGLVIGAYAGVLPALRTRLGVDAGILAVLLFVAGVSAVASMQVGGRLTDRVGGRRIGLASIPFMLAGTMVLAFAETLAVAILGVALIGLGNGAMDVAMNALGVAVEKTRPTPVMSRLHAFWSVGSFGGAGIILLTTVVTGDRGGSVVTPALLVVTALCIVTIGLVARWIPDTPRLSHVRADGAREPIPPQAWLLGAIAACAGLMEGTAYDWSAIHVADVARVDPGIAAIGLVTVSLFMITMRFLGDFVVVRLGHRRVVRGGALSAAAGYALAALATPLPLILVGWALVGLGVALMSPQIYATAGHLGGGRMLAVVVTFGYAAAMGGPAVLGWLVHSFGVQQAMLLPVVLGVVLTILSRWMPAITRGPG